MADFLKPWAWALKEHVVRRDLIKDRRRDLIKAEIGQSAGEWGDLKEKNPLDLVARAHSLHSTGRTLSAAIQLLAGIFCDICPPALDGHCCCMRYHLTSGLLAPPSLLHGLPHTIAVLLVVKLSPAGLLGRVGCRVSPRFRPECRYTAHSEQTALLVVKLCESTCLHQLREARAATIFPSKTIFSSMMARAGQESMYCYVFKLMW